MSTRVPDTSAWGWLVIERGGVWCWVAFGPPGRTRGEAPSRRAARAAADRALVQLRLVAVVRDGDGGAPGAGGKRPQSAG